jgi:nucleotide-binding universal stress UspA family protein
MKIVVGYDGSEHAKRALERAAAMADGGAVSVVAGVHVTPPLGRGGGRGSEDPFEAEGADKALEDAKAFLASKGIETRVVKGVGDPGKAIVDEATDWGADLIVVGTRGLSLAERVVLGSVSTWVLHHAPCDVLVAR